jgi:hypothetical protein
MTDEEFIDKMRRIRDKDLETYSNLLETVKKDEATDHNWQMALDIYQRLESNERVLFRGFIRQIMTDTLATVLAILDGMTRLDKQASDFMLLYENAKLNGDLAEIFLRKEEEDRR